jgi:hypothetical protein
MIRDINDRPIMDGMQEYVDGLFRGEVPILPGFKSDRTGRIEMPYAFGEARPLNERLLDIVFKDGPLTEEEAAYLEAAERSAR